MKTNEFANLFKIFDLKGNTFTIVADSVREDNGVIYFENKFWDTDPVDPKISYYKPRYEIVAMFNIKSISGFYRIIEN